MLVALGIQQQPLDGLATVAIAGRLGNQVAERRFGLGFVFHQVAIEAKPQHVPKVAGIARVLLDRRQQHQLGSGQLLVIGADVPDVGIGKATRLGVVG